MYLNGKVKCICKVSCFFRIVRVNGDCIRQKKVSMFCSFDWNHWDFNTELILSFVSSWEYGRKTDPTMGTELCFKMPSLRGPIRTSDYIRMLVIFLPVILLIFAVMCEGRNHLISCRCWLLAVLQLFVVFCVHVLLVLF